MKQNLRALSNPNVQELLKSWNELNDICQQDGEANPHFVAEISAKFKDMAAHYMSFSQDPNEIAIRTMYEIFERVPRILKNRVMKDRGIIIHDIVRVVHNDDDLMELLQELIAETIEHDGDELLRQSIDALCAEEKTRLVDALIFSFFRKNMTAILFSPSPRFPDHQ